MAHTFNEAAKLLGTGQKKLFKLLRQDGVLSPRNFPKQSYINRGLFIVKHRSFTHPITGLKHYSVTQVTDKGLDWIAHNYNLNPAEKQTIKACS